MSRGKAIWGFKHRLLRASLQADELDYAIRKKDPKEADAAYAATKSSLDSAIASLG